LSSTALPTVDAMFRGGFVGVQLEQHREAFAEAVAQVDSYLEDTGLEEAFGCVTPSWQRWRRPVCDLHVTLALFDAEERDVVQWYQQHEGVELVVVPTHVVIAVGYLVCVAVDVIFPDDSPCGDRLLHVTLLTRVPCVPRHSSEVLECIRPLLENDLPGEHVGYLSSLDMEVDIVVLPVHGEQGLFPSLTSPLQGVLQVFVYDPARQAPAPIEGPLPNEWTAPVAEASTSGWEDPPVVDSVPDQPDAWVEAVKPLSAVVDDEARDGEAWVESVKPPVADDVMSTPACESWVESVKPSIDVSWSAAPTAVDGWDTVPQAGVPSGGWGAPPVPATRRVAF